MKVDLEALVVAFSDDSVERSYYLDSDSGRVFNVLEDHDDPETRELVWALESDTRGRYIQIPKPSLEETLEEQDAFVESLEGDMKTITTERSLPTTSSATVRRARRGATTAWFARVSKPTSGSRS